MKKLTFTLLIVFLVGVGVSSAGAEDWFRDGTSWELAVRGTHMPDAPVHFDMLTLEGDTVVGGYTGFKMYLSDSYVNHKLCAVVRTEGEKVYCVNHAGSEEWTLLFDYGLQPGEETVVGDIVNWNNDREPNLFTAKCIGREPLADYGGIEALKVDLYYNQNPEFFDGWNYWLPGIGGTSGPLTQNVLIGIGYQLVKVEHDGEVICQHATVGGDSTTAQEAKVALYGRNLFVEGVAVGTDVTVHSVDGCCVYSGRAASGQMEIALPSAGCFIVSVGGRSVKVLAE